MMNDTWGDWGDAGFRTMMEDEHTLTGIVKEKYPNIPYFMFGHSMGSFIARDYAAHYGDELTGLIICGTAGKFQGAAEVLPLLEAAVKDGRGKESDPQYAGQLLGWMGERCGEVKLGNEWICSDPYVQMDHAQDPFDAFTKATTNQAMRDFVQMMLCIEGTEWAEQVPVALPIYNIAGDQDPVGNYGEGVYLVSNWLYRTGHNVQTKLYSGLSPRDPQLQRYQRRSGSRYRYLYEWCAGKINYNQKKKHCQAYQLQSAYLVAVFLCFFLLDCFLQR